jgi:hypothetical protein
LNLFISLAIVRGAGHPPMAVARMPDRLHVG